MTVLLIDENKNKLIIVQLSANGYKDLSIGLNVISEHALVSSTMVFFKYVMYFSIN